MSHLPTHKRFPGPTGVDTSPRVSVSTPIPLRDEPLEGLKKMEFPKGKGEDILPILFQFRAAVPERKPWWSLAMLRKKLLWLLMIAAGLIVFLLGSALLFTLLTGF